MRWANYHSDDDMPLSRRSSRSPSPQKRRRRLRASSAPDGRFLIDKETYTSGQAARLLRIPPRTLRRYLSIGKLEGDQNPITQTWHISSESLADFIRAQGGDVVIKQTKINCLVIDSSDDIPEALRTVEEETHFEIVLHCFEEVGDALIEIGMRRPDLVIVNTTNPRYDGLGLIRVLKSNTHLRGIKILAVVEADSALVKAEELKNVKTLSNPIAHSALLQTLNAMFSD